MPRFRIAAATMLTIGLTMTLALPANAAPNLFPVLTPTLGWGLPGDIPVPGRYLPSDSGAEPAVFRPSEGRWYVINSLTNVVTTWWFGAAGDVPVPGDYDGDGLTDPAVFPPGSPTPATTSAGGTK